MKCENEKIIKFKRLKCTPIPKDKVLKFEGQ
jgi:hypothetical protein